MLNPCCDADAAFDNKIARGGPFTGVGSVVHSGPNGRCTSAAETCQLLREDPDLADAIPFQIRQRAIAECVAPVACLRRGRWTGQQPYVSDDAIGLLVLGGLLIRRVGIDSRFGAELLGQGDLLRPWQDNDPPSTMHQVTRWRVLQPTRLAVLDQRVAQRLARYPELTGRLAGRALQRSRALAVNVAIIHQPRVDVRLHMLFWHLAGRWGHVRADGIILRLGLTHTVLAELVAARRPTVTVALSELANQGLVRVIGNAWHLSGEPPGELPPELSLQPQRPPRGTSVAW
jgi:CRP/FNR family cyclic AMP-dependent transcriptional regulator